MNPELQKALAAFVAECASLVKSGADQIPEVLREVVLYGQIKASVGLAFFLVAAVVCAFFGFRAICTACWLEQKKLEHMRESKREELEAGFAVGGILLSAAVIPLSGGVLYNAANLVKSIIAPRLYILDWLRDWL